MRHLTALVIKYFMIALVLGVILGLAGGASLSQILVVSAILTVIAYVIGDLMILPATQNWIAVAANATIAWAVLRYACRSSQGEAPPVQRDCDRHRRILLSHVRTRIHSAKDPTFLRAARECTPID